MRRLASPGHRRGDHDRAGRRPAATSPGRRRGPGRLRGPAVAIEARPGPESSAGPRQRAVGGDRAGVRVAAAAGRRWRSRRGRAPSRSPARGSGPLAAIVSAGGGDRGAAGAPPAPYGPRAGDRGPQLVQAGDAVWAVRRCAGRVPGPGGATRRGPGREGKRGRGTRDWAGGTRTGGRGKGERIEMGGVQRIRRAHHMKRILNCASQ